MTSILKSGEIGAFVDLQTTCTRPEPLDPEAARAPARLRKPHDLRPRRGPLRPHGLPPLRRAAA